MKRKFDICYVIAKENLSFHKYPVLHELEEYHGVDLGFAYNTEVSAQTFTHYIAESRRQSFLNTFSKSIFYSFLMGGSTDAGNVEVELVLVQYCTQDDPSQETDAHITQDSGIACTHACTHTHKQLPLDY